MGVNLEKAIKRERDRMPNEDDVLVAVKRLYHIEDVEDSVIVDRLKKGPTDDLPPIHPDSLEADHLYHEDHIRSLCIKYRLRFLDASLFQGAIPYEAIAKIKRLQRKENIPLKHFKMVAPAGLFQLKHKDKDPMLFLNLGQGKYYLIHQWGRDLHPLRALLMYPFRSFSTLFRSVVFLSFIIALSIPSSVMVGPYDSSSWPIRGIFFFYVLIALCGLTALYGFSRLKNFSSVLWNSVYDD